jgi:uncharacterized spore protein YtfJ
MSTKYNMDYKQKVSDEELVAMIEQGVMNSVGDFLNSSSLAKERQKSTYEYAMQPWGHLEPNGVSRIVSSDTVEAVEGYSAVLSELMFNNNKIARFIPLGDGPKAYSDARKASDLVNYCIFKQNPGWQVLNTWVKSSLLWKNSIVEWEYIEDYCYDFEEYDEISQANLDIILADPDVEIVGELSYDQELQTNEETGQAEYQMVYKDVRLKRTYDKSRVKLTNIPPESFRITRDAESLDECAFVGIQFTTTRSEVRKEYPEIADTIDWDSIGDGSADWATKYTEEESARKHVVGEEYWIGGNAKELFPLEANQEITIIKCWLRVDRDGDGIAELKKFMIAGNVILSEEDVDSVQLASLCPFEIPHEFHGLSMADMARPSTLATTAILRGFVENTYLTNYSPKLADPNVVDFSALQNMKPKQIIATNGNPMNAVSALTPDTISTGTVPLLEYLQKHKEQATGLSKAAQGLNDTLYVSGNSEQKVSQVQSAAQIRIQHIARRYAETGIKRLIEGVYKTMKKNLKGKKFKYSDSSNFFQTIDLTTLPDNMMVIADVDVGEHSNQNTIKKMTVIGQQILPALMQAGAGAVINPAAAAVIAAKTIEALDLDPLDFIVDFTDPKFVEQAMQSRQKEQQEAEEQKMLAKQLQQMDFALKQANIDFTNTQTKNALQDNTKQLMVALDKSYQEWSKLYIEAAKEGIDLPERPSAEQLLQIAGKLIGLEDESGETEEAPGQPEQQQPMM